ncbi:MAG TPA: methyltransferase domain-containing protein [Solirubrobacteraceae bacterium]|nr:methyltransferase domain-containing protein [Solirubrobacteraceae bacterium]
MNADELRERTIADWDRAAPRWGRNADRLREFSMPVATWLIDRLELQPGQDVLELAAGPGDTGFLAAEMVKPGGRLICSDAAEGMLAVARERASALGIENVEFRMLQLEWIDLPAASVDAALCRWGLMFALDPGAALREMRRVVRPGGRLALAVWDAPERNPWAAVPGRAMIELGHMTPPEPGVPGPFTLADRERLGAMIEEAGFADVAIEAVQLTRDYPDADAFVAETTELSGSFRERWDQLADAQRAAVTERVRELTEPFVTSEGRLELTGVSLGAAAMA